jgi:hypothetical protein
LFWVHKAYYNLKDPGDIPEKTDSCSLAKVLLWRLWIELFKQPLTRRVRIGAVVFVAIYVSGALIFPDIVRIITFSIIAAAAILAYYGVIFLTVCVLVLFVPYKVISLLEEMAGMENNAGILFFSLIVIAEISVLAISPFLSLQNVVVFYIALIDLLIILFLGLEFLKMRYKEGVGWAVSAFSFFDKIGQNLENTKEAGETLFDSIKNHTCRPIEFFRRKKE